MRVVLLVSAVLFLTGCVSTSVNEFFRVDDAPVGATNASNTGAYPDFNEIPAGETRQLSGSETAAEKQKLAEAASKGRSQAASSNQADYEAEVARLRKLAEDQQSRRDETIKAVDAASQ